MTAIFKPLRQIQFIAALGDSSAQAGSGATNWGLWRVDPGPRGVRLGDFTRLQAAGCVAPAKWVFDHEDWWLEEHGLIMEKPEFPLPPGKYLVTGDRELTTTLTVGRNDSWTLAEGCLGDVTHLPCRAARYRGGTPACAVPADFPVRPGDVMPEVPSSVKTDYAVLFVVGVEDTGSS
jgi:hypothetical protein